MALMTPHSSSRFRCFATAALLSAVLLAAACQPTTQLPSVAAPPSQNTPAEVSGMQPTGAPTGGPTVAFVRDQSLMVQADAPVGPVMEVESCADRGCRFFYPKWSPDGQTLLYYVGSFDSSTAQQIRVMNRSGQTQTITEHAAYIRPADWSPDGSALVYLEDTDRYADVSDGPAQRVFSVQTVPFNANMSLGTPSPVGEVLFGEGCGGGGRSESALAYEDEGGFAYGYLAAIVEWTPHQILLYNDNCTSSGVARYDLTTGQPLDPYPVRLRSLDLDPSGNAWIAIDEQGHAVTGTPDSLTVSPVTTSQPPELVFNGDVTGQFYYTTLQYTGDRDLMDLAAGLDQSILLQPFFDTTQAALVSVDPATGQETTLYKGDGYAYANVAEQPDGSLIFARVEDNQELMDALQAGQITAENWSSFLPHTDLLRLESGAAMPVVWLENAEQARITAP